MSSNVTVCIIRGGSFAPFIFFIASCPEGTKPGVFVSVNVGCRSCSFENISPCALMSKGSIDGGCNLFLACCSARIAVVGHLPGAVFTGRSYTVESASSSPRRP